MVLTCSENGRGKTPKTGYEMEYRVHQEEGNEVDLNSLGWKGFED
jgi:hypothetical protein